MKTKTRYTEESMGELKIIKDFLPTPDQLALKEENVKITISLKKSSVSFFKEQAKKHKTSYQKMIREVVDWYASHCGEECIKDESTTIGDILWLSVDVRSVHLRYAAFSLPRGARAPCRRPCVVRSSSMSGQCIPYPAPAMRQLARCSGEACSNRGYHARGTVMVRPSKRSTLIVSSERRTPLTRSPVLGSEVLMPRLQ